MLVREQGSSRLTVSANGQATISGKAGMLAFSASEATQQLGLALRNIIIFFSAAPNGTSQYSASFHFANAMRSSLSGSVDIEELILACSGWLCRAARAIHRERRTEIIEQQLRGVLGQ